MAVLIPPTLSRSRNRASGFSRFLPQLREGQLGPSARPILVQRPSLLSTHLGHSEMSAFDRLRTSRPSVYSMTEVPKVRRSAC